MKNKIFFIAIILVVFAGCNSDFLNQKPLGVQTTASFLGDPSTAEQNFEYMIRATYEVLNWCDGQWSASVLTTTNHMCDWMFGDMLSDDGVKGGNGPGDQSEFNDWRDWNPASGEAHENAFWLTGWTGVARANAVINALETYKSNLSAITYKRIKGEAYFLRAYFYFNLEREYGQFPYFTQPVQPSQIFATSTLMKTPEQIYANIEADLTTADSLALVKSQWQSTFNVAPEGRGTKGAVEAIKARVIAMEIGFGFNNKTPQDLYNVTESIISSGEYSLSANYATNFEMEGENNSESVFEIQCANLNQGYGGPGGNLWTIMLSPRFTAVDGTSVGRNLYSGWGFDCPTHSLFNEFEVTTGGTPDPRRSCSIIKNGDYLYADGIASTNELVSLYDSSTDCPTGYFGRKYAIPPALSPGATNDNTPVNIRVCRYADVLLLNAEAAYGIGPSKYAEAIGILNQIRERARASSGPKGSQYETPGYPSPSSDPNLLKDIPSSVTGPALLTAIKHERRCELAMEGFYRYWDLIRWGQYEDAINEYVSADWELKLSPAQVLTNFKSHLIHTGKLQDVPCWPIPESEVTNFQFPQNPGY
jgi:hypothetical protein